MQVRVSGRIMHLFAGIKKGHFLLSTSVPVKLVSLVCISVWVVPFFFFVHVLHAAISVGAVGTGIQWQFFKSSSSYTKKKNPP